MSRKLNLYKEGLVTATSVCTPKNEKFVHIMLETLQYHCGLTEIDLFRFQFCYRFFLFHLSLDGIDLRGAGLLGAIDRETFRYLETKLEDLAEHGSVTIDGNILRLHFRSRAISYSTLRRLPEFEQVEKASEFAAKAYEKNLRFPILDFDTDDPPGS